ncbi:MAG: LamG-like jellyroll fold domain-containing protein, partial [Gallionellaceae bacterium]
ALLTVNPAPTNCDAAPLGLVSWWPGEGNTDDVIGTNNGVLVNGGYTAGEVGQAFYLNGTNAYVKMPAGPSLNVGLENGLTIEGWIDPSVVDVMQPIVDWNNGSTWGAHFWISLSSPYGTGAGCLYANLRDTSGSFHSFSSAAGLIRPNVYQHVALTFDKGSGMAAIYLNGAVVAQQNLGTNFIPQTSYDFYLGVRISDVPPTLWAGNLDEFSVYNRALSSNEIAAIYLAGSGGKCPPGQPPVITMQPTNQTVIVGQTAMFTVSATGSQPLNYQWMLNATNLAGATNASLILNDVQLSQAGPYAVKVSNPVASALSSNAVLTVLTLAPTNCDPVPSGLVSWWPGEGNADDIVSGNSGVLVNGGYTNGEVGQAFYLNGTNAFVKVPASPSLNVGIGNGLTVEGWINPSVVDSSARPIAEWNNHSNGGVWGVHLWDSQSASSYGTGPGCLFANIQDANNNPPNGYHTLASAAGIVQANVYQHVALTYDRTSGVATIYLNGVNVAQTTFFTNIVPQTSYDFYLGVRASDVPPTLWAGSLDEFSVYNRALSSNEIAAIYLAGGGGKCFTPVAPVVTMQPTNQTVVEGQTATFSVNATGTRPLNYQWMLNTTNLAGATNASLILTNVQLTNAGNYTVTVTNAYGSVTSSNALLTVNPAPTNCDAAPLGLVSWWPGEGNTDDVIGTNNGVLV